MEVHTSTSSGLRKGAFEEGLEVLIFEKEKVERERERTMSDRLDE